MTGTLPSIPACAEMQMLIQADLDGELDAAATSVLTVHVMDCPGCAALQADLTALSRDLHATLRSLPATPRLRASLEAKLAVTPPARLRPRIALSVFNFAAGAAVAASLLLLAPLRAGPGLDAELFSGHVRALQASHLLDVPSTDRHTVKPWFEGRLDFAPEVPDFAAQGFPLIGGRLDVIGGRSVAVLVYRHDKHPINVFVWPAGASIGAETATRDGYALHRWTHDGLMFSAVSDLDPINLASFVLLFQTRG